MIPQAMCEANTQPNGARGLGEEESRTTLAPAPIDRASDALLLFYSDLLDDMEKVRIANENRLRSLVSDWGKGMSSDLPEVAILEDAIAHLCAIEHGVTLALKRAMRAHPLGPWCKRNVGIGEKQLGRLLGAIGNPADRPNVGKLWAYCGLHVWNGLPGTHPTSATHTTGGPGESLSGGAAQPRSDVHEQRGVAPRHIRGVRANWSDTAKMRVYLVAESCIKQRTSPFRPFYDAGREKYAESVHSHPCARCGPKGVPAEVGSPLSDGHKHARAMRLVMKAILKDLWREAVAVHPNHDAQVVVDAVPPSIELKAAQ